MSQYFFATGWHFDPEALRTIPGLSQSNTDDQGICLTDARDHVWFTEAGAQSYGGNYPERILALVGDYLGVVWVSEYDWTD